MAVLRWKMVMLYLLALAALGLGLRVALKRRIRDALWIALTDGFY